MKHTYWIMTVGLLAAACGSSTSPYGGGSSGGGYGGGGGGYGGGGSGTGGASATITVANDYFTPTPDTIAASSGAVSFHWASPSNGHGVTWDSGPGTLPPNALVSPAGTTFFVTGLTPGRYEFHCPVHGGPGTGMHGSIVVR